jgi:hypothetical protein
MGLFPLHDELMRRSSAASRFRSFTLSSMSRGKEEGKVMSCDGTNLSTDGNIFGREAQHIPDLVERESQITTTSKRSEAFVSVLGCRYDSCLRSGQEPAVCLPDRST